VLDGPFLDMRQERGYLLSTLRRLVQAAVELSNEDRDPTIPMLRARIRELEAQSDGAAQRIRELEEWQRKRTKITGQVIDETVVLEERIANLEAELAEARDVITEYRREEDKYDIARTRIRELEEKLANTSHSPDAGSDH
jgi:DNA repair exonuclease SbcCD ATPase subunit